MEQKATFRYFYGEEADMHSFTGYQNYYLQMTISKP